MSINVSKKRAIRCLVCNARHLVPFDQVDFICKCTEEDGSRTTSDRMRVDIDDPNVVLQGGDSFPLNRSKSSKKDSTFKQNQEVNTYNTIPR